MTDDTVDIEELIRIKREELVLEEKKRELEEGLPFLYGWKWYTWARAFYDSVNKINLLTAANQISKSSTQIRKAINWATNKKLWPSLWVRRPSQFWYFYPTAQVASIEFEEKWKQFLPTGKYKDDPIYGWSEEWKNKEIFAVHFKSGVSIYFKSYSQDVSHLQSGTVDAIFCDEEMPVELYDELMFRLSASNGYFHMVFTATLGQEFWRLAMEPGSEEKENLPSAFKQTVSMYDCMEYDDGTPSHWTMEKIQVVVSRCKDADEVARRVHGKFIRPKGGRKCPSFDIKKHMKPFHPIPKDWLVYEGVDLGSGGEENHPAAICFVAVNPNFREGRVYVSWRGDGIATTQGDVFNKHLELKRKYNLNPVLQQYDQSGRDFYQIATDYGESFITADKSVEAGVDLVDTLFKFDMLYIYDTDENRKLAGELLTLRKDTPKTKAKDDLFDALRYAVKLINWDRSVITNSVKLAEPERVPNDKEREIEARRDFVSSEIEEDSWAVDAEIAEWNDAYSG